MRCCRGGDVAGGDAAEGAAEGGVAEGVAEGGAAEELMEEVLGRCCCCRSRRPLAEGLARAGFMRMARGRSGSQALRWSRH